MLPKKLPINKIKELVNKIDKKELIRVVKPYYIAVLVLLIFVSVYHVYFAHRLVPGIYIAGLKVGGNTFDQAVERLKEQESNIEKKLTLHYEGKIYELNGDEIGLEYDWEATVNRAFEVGRTGVFFVDSKDKIAGLFKDLYIAAYYDFEDDLFANFLNTIKGELNSPADNAHFFIKNDTELEVKEETSGQVIDDQTLYRQVITSFDDFNFGNKSIQAQPSVPNIYAKDLENVLDISQKIVFNPIKLIFEDGKDKSEWKITPEEKLSFIIYEYTSGEMVFNKVAFQSFLERVEPTVNRLPKGKVTDNEEGRVVTFELKEAGRQLDTDMTAEDFKNALFGLKNESAIKFTSLDGDLNTKDYGIYALLGEGKSWFSGSAAGRIHNLTLAAERTDGVLIAPGETYSFNESVGDITAATGYDSAWVILGSRTVLGHGGGVCQTSTTLFRAILDSGLPVLSRHPHAYRVRYYEINSPIGIDASIYQPSLDLQFKNDTRNHVLVQSSWDLEEASMTFKIYGTPDGRKVEISEPVVTSQSPPPEALYQDDPTLDKGVVRQIDFPAWGANVSFTRKVTRGEEVLYEDVFKTNYQPWRAIYLVGTKE